MLFFQIDIKYNLKELPRSFSSQKNEKASNFNLVQVLSKNIYSIKSYRASNFKCGLLPQGVGQNSYLRTFWNLRIKSLKMLLQYQNWCLIVAKGPYYQETSKKFWEKIIKTFSRTKTVRCGLLPRLTL